MERLMYYCRYLFFGLECMRDTNGELWIHHHGSTTHHNHISIRHVVTCGSQVIAKVAEPH